jgi:glycosyltransferase involved in cell wall biosynthesis
MDQTCDDYEVILVDDCSDDYSCDLLQHWKEEGNVRILRNHKNLGLGASCNVGVRASRARYIVRVDADDYVCKDFVYMLSRFLDHSPYFDAVKCDYYTVDRDCKTELVSAAERPIACGIMFRRAVLWEIGLYTEDRSIREDIELIDRFDLGKFRMAHLQTPLYRYHQHPGSLIERFEDGGTRPSISVEEAPEGS